MSEAPRSARFVVREDLLVEDFENELLILDLARDLCFGLNRLGAVIWNALGEGRSLAEVVDAICARVTADRETVATDVAALVGQLVDRGLIRAAT